MSVWVIAIDAARIAVKIPIAATITIASGALAKIAFVRAMRETPALTIVAAWISAETGVGPSIASGSQTWSGNWALLPTAPAKTRRATIQIGIVSATPGAVSAAMESRMFSVPWPRARVFTKIAMIPSA